jgi:hypothetical protein
MEMFETRLPPSPAASQLAREWLRPKLHAQHLDGLTDTTELLLTELIANVVRHVGAPMAIRLLCAEGAVRVEVDDPSLEPPVVRRFDVDGETGRGLLLLAALSRRWGTKRLPDAAGKTVWFEVGPEGP